MSHRRLGKFAAVATLAALVAGCSALDRRANNLLPQTPYHDENVLRVGITATYPPLIFERDGEVVGLEADMARALGRELGKEVRFIEIPWPQQIEALMDRRTDIIMAGMTITRARQVRIAFTQPYLEIGQQGLVRRQDYDRYSSLESPFYDRARIGVEAGTTGDFVVQDLFHKAKRVPFDSAREGAAALAEGRIDVFIHDSPVIWWLASEREVEGIVPLRGMFTREYLAWGVRVGDEGLRESANRVLAEWKQDGTLAEFVKRWLPYVDPAALEKRVPETLAP